MKLVIFDLETTGLDPEQHTIIQIAAIAVNAEFNEIDQFEAKVKFRLGDADPTALAGNTFGQFLPDIVQGIPYERDSRVDTLPNTDFEVFKQAYSQWAKVALHPATVEGQFTRFLKKHATVPNVSKRGKIWYSCAVAGHNAARFDLPFLQAWYKKLGQFCLAHFFPLDTMLMAWERKLLEGIQYPDLKLETLAQHHGVALAQEHDALTDVRITAALIPLIRTGSTFADIDNLAVDVAAEKAQAIIDGLPDDLKGGQ